MINKKMGDELARELGAVKYLEFFKEDFGRRDIIVLDEVAFAGLGKIKDEKEKQERTKNDKILREKYKIDKKHQEKIDRDLLLFLLLALSMVIFSIVVNVL